MSDHNLLPARREQSLGRRGFLRVSAASAATVALVAAGCTTETPEPVKVDPFLLTLPANDAGLFYFAYLLSIAKAAIYQKVADAPPTDFTATDRAVFADLRDHEVIHRELLRRLLDPKGEAVLLPSDFAFSLTSLTLTTRAGALAAAQQLADLAAAVYPTVLPLLTPAALLTRALLLKMSSVHARHAATLRDLRAPGSFATDDAVFSTGLLAGQLRPKTPLEVLVVLAPSFAPYVISAGNLPLPV